MGGHRLPGGRPLGILQGRLVRLAVRAGGWPRVVLVGNCGFLLGRVLVGVKGEALG